MSWLYFKRKNICCELQGTLVRVQLISSFTNRQVLKVMKRIKLVRREAVGRHHRGRRIMIVIRVSYPSYDLLNPLEMRVIETAHLVKCFL